MRQTWPPQSKNGFGDASFPEFNPDKSPLLLSNCLVGDTIAQISMNLSTNQPDLVIFAEILAYLPLRTQILHRCGA